MIAVVILAGEGPELSAQDGGRRHRMGPDPDRMSQCLELTTAQQESMEGIHDDFLTEMKKIRENGELDPVQRIQAQFAFNMAIDLGHYLFALLLLGILSLVGKLQHRSWPAVILGSLTIFLAMVLSATHILSGSTKILASEDRTVPFTYKRYAPQNNLTTRQVQRGKGMMTTPVMVYLSIEPFEVRQEILVSASELLNFRIQGSQNILEMRQPVPREHRRS